MTASVHQELWQSLGAATQSRSPFTTMQLATIGMDGAPRVRTVVLRQADEVRSTVSFVTDLRSPKIAEIRREPRVSLVGYDPQAGIQVRLEGRAVILDQPEDKKSIWDRCRPHTLALFQTPDAPGTEIASPRAVSGTVEHCDGTEQAFRNFCVVTVELQRLEWLDLSPEGHQRCFFRQTAGSWVGTWIAP
ncbi:pyridoxamine 5'-phosphate oxidase family protein [Microvirga aerilata]|jgi:pyridoxamine 5'-phosphate oxidase|uniref:Pyridoxamine 5'-phosphate oxidase family protein n=1 Tax=Microvirga aerilata TaxID=670292 RepID=A0A936ZJA4_9HYPH|nr:pyridoxamine 5'-phosphate oxidase family protein [Microvirga aerilata]MBL0405623.1 pyridoxamine 5'-phosphate oxidase family protein [Microvirga aerilata]